MKIFLHITLLVSSTFIYCQEVNKIKILNADEIISDSDLHPDYWRLIGNIKFQNKETIMYCDSAHHYKKEDKIRAYGKIKIDGKNRLHINGKKLEYIALTKNLSHKGKHNYSEVYANTNTQDGAISAYLLSKNIIHLVLARTPNAPEGIKGISLFLVPKYS